MSKLHDSENFEIVCLRIVANTQIYGKRKIFLSKEELSRFPQYRLAFKDGKEQCQRKL